jgi:uncharacterized protein
MANFSSFFEIPASDFKRAATFYGGVFEVKLNAVDFHGTTMAFFPRESPTAVTGAIVCGEGYTPSTDGVIIYLDGGKDLNSRLDIIEKLGGKVIVPKTQISEEAGYFAQFIDTEGNRMALHSMA